MGNVKKRFLKVDYINTDKVRGEITQIQQYTNAYNLGDFTSDNDIPNVRAVRDIAGSLISPEYEVLVESADVSPLEIPVSELWANGVIKTYPKASATIALYDTDDTDTNEGVMNVRVDYVFTDDTKTELESILVYGFGGDTMGMDIRFVIS